MFEVKIRWSTQRCFFRGAPAEGGGILRVPPGRSHALLSKSSSWFRFIGKNRCICHVGNLKLRHESRAVSKKKKKKLYVAFSKAWAEAGDLPNCAPTQFPPPALGTSPVRAVELELALSKESRPYPWFLSWRLLSCKCNVNITVSCCIVSYSAACCWLFCKGKASCSGLVISSALLEGFAALHGKLTSFTLCMTVVICASVPCWNGSLMCPCLVFVRTSSLQCKHHTSTCFSC